jgi:hypothetical protein
MTKGNTMNKIGSTLVAGAACAACCAPLVWPFFSAALLGGGGSLAIDRYLDMDVETLLCILGLILGTAIVAYFGHRYWKRKNELQSGATCEIGGACDPKGSQQ